MAKRTVHARAAAWARRRPQRIRGRNPWAVAVDLIRNTVEDRVVGLASEMAFWSLLSFFPLVVTMSALLGYAEAVVGREQLDRGRDAIVSALSVVFSADLIEEVVDPFIGGLLQNGRGGLALTSLLITVYLASRVFTATIRSLDLAYRVEEGRGLVAQRLRAIGFALGFVVVVVTTLLLMVLGPLLGTGESIADRFGMGDAFAFTWSVFRWPVLLIIMVLFLATVYLYGPNVQNRFRHCLPGAILGVLLWSIASIGLRVYLDAGGTAIPALDSGDASVALVGRVVGTLLAMMLWVFVTGFAILVGGELNALVAPPEGRRGVVQSEVPSGTMPNT